MSDARPLRTVLAATDLSAPARHALDRAADLAREHGATLALAHAISGSRLDELRRWLGQDTPAPQELMAEAAGALHALAQAAHARAGVTVAEHVSAGSVLDELGRLAETLDADLLVVGARGLGYLRRMALGSTGERLLRRSRRPVLVVRQAPRAPYRRILVPVDFSAWTDATLREVRRLAPHAHLVLLHVWEVPFEGKLRFAGVADAVIGRYRRDARDEAMRRLAGLAADHGLAPHTWTASLPEGDPALRISEQEQEQDCDLVAIGKHGRNVAEDLLLGSVTQHVLGESQGDVLVVTAPVVS